MRHEFNMPFQLANPSILDETDWPSDADLYNFDICDGDVIIMGSDGLFDNIWNDDLARLVYNTVIDNKKDMNAAQKLSQRLADLAHFNAQQNDIKTPWAAEVGTASMVIKKSFMMLFFYIIVKCQW